MPMWRYDDAAAYDAMRDAAALATAGADRPDAITSGARWDAVLLDGFIRDHLDARAEATRSSEGQR